MDIEDMYAKKEVRGPVFWKFLHTITITYWEEHKDQYEMFFNDILPILIPCEECAEHYKLYIEKNPLVLDSRDGLVKWLLDFHNFGNRMKGCKEYSFDEMLNAMFERDY